MTTISSDAVRLITDIEVGYTEYVGARPADHPRGFFRGYLHEGVRVGTTHGDIRALISAGQQCCETYGGEIVSNDHSPDYFIGAPVFEVRVTDGSGEVHEDVGMGDYENAAFIDIVTIRGVLQLTVYNHHNGYYGHDVILLDGETVLDRGTL